MADAALKGQGAERADPAGPSAVAPAIIPQDAGGVVVDFNGPMPEAPRFCIPLVFHTFSLQEALVSSVFCFHHTDLLPVFT